MKDAAPYRISLLVLLVCLVPLLAVACGEDEGEPVATLSVDPARSELPYGSFEDLELTWTPGAALDGVEGSPRVFLHLLAGDGDLVRTFDLDLPFEWRTGGERTHEARIYQSLLAPPLPPGDYALTAGLYDGAGNRWSLDTAGESMGRREYRVGTVAIPSGAGEGLPSVTYSPTWSPARAGSDRQVVAFRTLARAGTLTLSEIPGPGTLWLLVGVPPDGIDGMRRRMLDPSEMETADADDAGEDGAEGAAEETPAPAATGSPGGPGGTAEVIVTASCTGFESRLTAEGSHRVEIPVEAGASGTPCEIGLRPNYVLVSPEGEERSINLEVLAWAGSPD